MLGETVNQWDYILLLVKNDRLNLNVRSYDTVLKDSLHDKLSCIEKICKGQNSRIIQVEDKIFLDYQISNELRTIEIKNRYWEDINTKGLHHVIAEMRSNN